MSSASTLTPASSGRRNDHAADKIGTRHPQRVISPTARRDVKTPSLVVNYLTTQIGMVEAGEGAAIIPSYWNIDRSNRGLRMSRLVNPVAHLDFCQIRRAGRRLPMVAEEFTAFVRHYISAREGKAGAL